MAWTEAKEKHVKALWLGGMHGTAIAEAVGLNRNQVMGKLGRMGLLTRKADAKEEASVKSEKSRAVRAPRKRPSRAARTSPPPVSKKIEGPQHIGLFDLSLTTCRWPYGDIRTAPLTFCGAHVNPDKPYCPSHAAIAFEPPRPRRTLT